MKAVKVKIKEAENVKKLLITKELYNYEYKIFKDKDYIYFPIKSSNKSNNKLEIVDIPLTKKTTTSLRDLLSVPNRLIKYIPTGFDNIGDIAILEIPEQVILYEKQIAKALLTLHKNIKTVVKKASVHEGIFRTRRYKHLAGKDTKETVYKENNVKLKLNIEEVYFSERLSHERLRIASQIKPGENILVMFSGVGPYVFVISKNTLAKKVTGIEINPIAHKYALENQKLNKTRNTEFYLGDVKAVIPKLKEKYDRILMPLPKTGELFLKTAFKVIKDSGIIHFYDFLNQKDFPKESIKKINKEKGNLKITILNSVKCGSYSPANYRTCIDFKVNFSHQNN
jgi:tRNA (guanine37-N1)-methyltransferase